MKYLLTHLTDDVVDVAAQALSHLGQERLHRADELARRTSSLKGLDEMRARGNAYLAVADALKKGRYMFERYEELKS